MLVLTRKKDQVIRIGEDVILKVVAVSGDRVRLGFEAPKDIGIHRDEVYDRIKRGIPKPSDANLKGGLDA